MKEASNAALRKSGRPQALLAIELQHGAEAHKIGVAGVVRVEPFLITTDEDVPCALFTVFLFYISETFVKSSAEGSVFRFIPDSAN